jgi:hypothetical protein
MYPIYALPFSRDEVLHCQTPEKSLTLNFETLAISSNAKGEF